MNFNQLMKQAQVMQKRMDKLKKEFDEKEYTFSSSDHAIEGIIDGHLVIKQLKINEELLDKENKEVLEDLLMITVNEAIKKMNDEKENAMSEITGGINMPGLF
ncbi:MAG: YbaB/EbfC family nucleoid-associated protein [Erysipelotrichaceae bacterium]|nr:YbaB/EbfC family nucleoid-associated protein [Erysipelotrichaceae bacterium]